MRWSEDVVDNEFMNKKKSKSELPSCCFSLAWTTYQPNFDPRVECCIFHKQKSFGDWSDDDSDDKCTDCNKESDSNKSEDKSVVPPS